MVNCRQRRNRSEASHCQLPILFLDHCDRLCVQHLVITLRPMILQSVPEAACKCVPNIRVQFPLLRSTALIFARSGPVMGSSAAALDLPCDSSLRTDACAAPPPSSAPLPKLSSSSSPSALGLRSQCLKDWARSMHTCAAEPGKCDAQKRTYEALSKRWTYAKTPRSSMAKSLARHLLRL